MLTRFDAWFVFPPQFEAGDEENRETGVRHRSADRGAGLRLL